MHAFLNKYKFMQNLKITKNTNKSPTLKINIVLNVQNIKEIKGLRTSLNSVVSLWSKLLFEVDFPCHSPESQWRRNKNNKNQIKNKNKNKKLKVRNWVASQKALNL